MKPSFAVLAPLCALCSFGAANLAAAQDHAQTRDPAPIAADRSGRTLFERQCGPCHGTGPGADGAPMLPGTAALAQKYQGRLPAALELREDLTVSVLTIILRRGVGEMPPFRPAELSDADIASIAGYIQKSAKAASVTAR